jgi:bis(5'-nucleosyl)-tetraphosphatase (symmetrical)
MATYAIGDIQGCFKPLRSLLEKIKFNSQQDCLWLLGDLVNRGPDSLATLRYLFSIRNSVKIVLGNHDLHFIAVHHGVRQLGKHDTLTELLAASDCATLVEWLCQQPLVYTDQQLGYSMVHAGIPPQWTIAEARGLSQEIEIVLQSSQRHDFLATMYGNLPNQWNDDLRGIERWRLITNYFTRMRFCTAQGEIELLTKEKADAAPLGFAPWFSFVERKAVNNKILFGHWAALEGRTHTANAIGMDTGCVWVVV